MQDSEAHPGETSEGASPPKYRAPALEKGLNILELLSRAEAPMPPTQIAQRLGKSLSELFRMLQVLEFRGYVANHAGDGYVLTDKLFALGLARAPIQSLLVAALPVMEHLAMATDQSCHLVFPSNDQIVVIARVESPGDLGFSVRVGYRRRLVEALSGAVLYAHQPQDVASLWLDRLSESATMDEIARFKARAAAIAKEGCAHAPSEFIRGVTDLVAPIRTARGAVAALTIPFLTKNTLRKTETEALDALLKAVDEIAANLAGGNRQPADKRA